MGAVSGTSECPDGCPVRCPRRTVLRGVRGSGTVDAVPLIQIRNSNTILELPDTVEQRVESGVNIVTLPDPAAPASPLVVGDGTGSPAIELRKTANGTAEIQLKVGTTLRWTIGLDSAENLRLRRYDPSGELQDTIEFSAGGGAVLPAGLTVSSGDFIVGTGNTTLGGMLTVSGATLIESGGLEVYQDGLRVTAGGFSLAAGNAVLTAGVRFVGNAPEAADDAAAAALSPTVPIGGWYHTAGVLMQRQV